MGQIIVEQIGWLLGASIPSIVAALGILVVGWLLALIVSALVRSAMGRTDLDRRLAQWFADDERPDGVPAGEWGPGVSSG